MLWLDMGLGKTVVALSVAQERIDRTEVWGVLVCGPVRVIQSVWQQEAQKWAHTHNLRFNVIHGNANRRTRQALMRADIYLVNYENLRWLADTWTHYFLSRGRYLPVNMVVYDEVSKMKNASAVRHEAMRRMTPFIPYRMGLTGTPAGNGYKDLFGQYLAVDQGARLGQTRKEYDQRFVNTVAMSPFAKGSLRSGAKETIEALIGDITLQMSNKDYLELPPVISNNIELTLPPDLQARYQEVEDKMFLELDSGAQVNIFNQASLSNRCLQFAQGAVYLEPGGEAYEVLHDIKLDALDSVVEEAAGKPILCAIEFRHDAYRILERYPDWVWVDSKMSGPKFNETLDRWCTGDLPGILAHPKSMAHGIDRLKDGPVDDLVWFGHTYSLDDYEQTIARLQRQGRTRPIRMHHLHMTHTTETAQRIALKMKARDQDGLKAALNEYRRQEGR